MPQELLWQPPNNHTVVNYSSTYKISSHQWGSVNCIRQPWMIHSSCFYDPGPKFALDKPSKAQKSPGSTCRDAAEGMIFTSPSLAHPAMPAAPTHHASLLPALAAQEQSPARAPPSAVPNQSIRRAAATAPPPPADSSNWTGVACSHAPRYVAFTPPSFPRTPGHCKFAIATQNGRTRRLNVLLY